MDSSDPQWGPFATPFEALGGAARVRSIVDRFYDIIDAEAPTLRAMLPRNDSGSRDKLHAYLVEWTGGPALYSPEHGQPLMRMRHSPFEIGADEVQEWLRCFGKSLDENEVSGDVRTFLDERVGALALHMQNQP